MRWRKKNKLFEARKPKSTTIWPERRNEKDSPGLTGDWNLA
jgi:hypothetical protein